MTAGLTPALRGTLLVVVAVGIFAVMDTIAKYLARSYPVPGVIWARYAANLLILLAFLAARGDLKRLRTARPGLQLMRGLLLAGASLLYFTSLTVLPLAEAAAIGFVMPLFLALLAVPMLGERMDGARLAAVLVGLLGALVIVRPGATLFTPYALLPVGMALCNALYQILTRQVAGLEHPLTSLAWGAIVGTVLFSFALPFGWVTPTDPWHWVLLGIIGLLASVGHFILIKAYDYASATGLAPFFYTQLVWVMLLGWLVFDDFPDGWSLLGMGIIVAAGIYLVGRQRLTMHRS
ncbi:MAG: DMT family transporter [Betaproteobacteria bacterium]|nr:DMT family transporter [Betaproteobacteria bacterium]MSQ89697.1 DMT family transporter [Betaproteobacteria bacterium]